MSENLSKLYQKDFALWAAAQADALREAAQAGINLPLDWENLAEEIESLGLSQKRELHSRLGRIIEHLLKLQYSPAGNPRPGWRDTVRQQRSEIELLLDQSPSLKRELPDMIVRQAPRTAKAVAESLADHGEGVGNIPPPAYTEEEVLGDWFPEPAKPAPRSPRGSGRPRRGGSGASRGAS
jgi:hypothetical protein